jgi:hypothetical protein
MKDALIKGRYMGKPLTRDSSKELPGKIKALELLLADLQKEKAAGVRETYKLKYLKYKQKYFQLKNRIS